MCSNFMGHIFLYVFITISEQIEKHKICITRQNGLFLGDIMVHTISVLGLVYFLQPSLHQQILQNGQ